MTFPGISGKEIEFGQLHPPAFQEALVISLGEALQLGRREPRRMAEAIKQDLPDALEDISLHRGIEPRDERLHVGLEMAE